MANITFTPGQDAFVSEWYPDLNFGGYSYLNIASSAGSGNGFRVVIMFNSINSFFQNSIPPDSRFNSAVLQLYISMNQIPSGQSINLNVNRVLQLWDETLVTWNNQPAYTPILVTAPITSGYFGTISLDITELVREWYTGAAVNYGIVLTADSPGNWVVDFNSREDPNTVYWPKLVMDYYQYFYSSL